MAIDWSPLTAPVPESSTSRGLRGIGDAMDAVLARRDRMERERMDAAAKQEAGVRADATKRFEARTRAGTATEATGQRRDAATTRAGQAGRRLNLQQLRDATALEKSRQAAIAGGDVDAAESLGTLYDRLMNGSDEAPSPGPAQAPAAPAPPPSRDTGVMPPAMGPSRDVVDPEAMEAPAPTVPPPLDSAPAAAPAPMARPPAMPMDPPAAMAARTKNVVQKLAEDWKTSQLALNPPPRLIPIIEQEAANIALKGRNYIGQAAQIVDRERTRTQSETNSELAGARRETLSASDEARIEESRAKGFGGELARWEAQSNTDKLTDAFQKFREFDSATEAYSREGDTINMRNSLYGIARYITGPGVLTAQEYGNTVSNTKGWGPALLTKIRKAATGDIAPQEAQAVQLFVRNARKAIRNRAVTAVQNFDKRFGPTSHYAQTIPAEVAAARAAVAHRFGVSDLETGPEGSSGRAEALWQRMKGQGGEKPK